MVCLPHSYLRRKSSRSQHQHNSTKKYKESLPHFIDGFFIVKDGLYNMSATLSQLWRVAGYTRLKYVNAAQ